MTAKEILKNNPLVYYVHPNHIDGVMDLLKKMAAIHPIEIRDEAPQSGNLITVYITCYEAYFALVYAHIGFKLHQQFGDSQIGIFASDYTPVKTGG